MPTSASLQALLANLIDYAGLYPPAALPLDRVVDNYQRYLASPERWMLNRLVLPANLLATVHPGPHWRITLLAETEPADLPACVETIETKTTDVFSRPVYRELPLSAIPDGFAKVRTGALTADGIPPAADLASFLLSAAARRLPFKATAGLHHPIRNSGTGMHGFINMFTAAAFAWHGAEHSQILNLLNETDPRAFQFSDAGVCFRGQSLCTPQIASARRDLAHSFGSCSFEEPVDDLRALGWLL